ncbi:MAG TPA: hypothetical protein VH370_26885 [Humisphaera sp.]|jgi:type II secretory pathway pseudopilin PulG|nr:hypothetical protein [Humisphaera sp.]
MKPTYFRSRSAGREAFTLVEMIIVVGIIVLLAALLLPMLNKALTQAKRTRMAADLQVITSGLDAYRLDFKDIPRLDGSGTIPGPLQGSALLCWALIAPGPEGFDGADGFGFRPRGRQGQVYGPYVTPGNFRLGTVTTSPLVKSTSFYDAKVCIADGAGNAILYYASRPAVTSIAGIDNYFGLVANGPNRYVADDNDPAVAGGTEIAKNPNPAAVVTSMQALLPGVRKDFSLDQSQILSLPYLLWDAGPDGKFGTSDDVTNFQK